MDELMTEQRRGCKRN